MNALPAINEAALEERTLELFRELGWETVSAMEEVFGRAGTLGRDRRQDVVLTRYLEQALERLNPSISSDAHLKAVEHLTADRSAMNPIEANREIYQLLKEGVKVPVRDASGEEAIETVRVIDWHSPENNHFLVVSQLWLEGTVYTRRSDLVGFVNGLPLLFMELKAAHNRVEDAFNDNLRDYKNAVPQVFLHNALIILSNGSDARLGSITSQWEQFSDWKKINEAGEGGVIAIDTMVRATCEKQRLLDLIENFTLFVEIPGGTAKILAKNHQYLGVNSAFSAFRRSHENQGRLGVFWHTQGSGKSFSMVFFAQKVLRKAPGNYTFVVVTDRIELDEQIYKNFAAAGAATGEETQAKSAAHLKQLLGEDHRYIFTLIHKFRAEPGQSYPMISDRSDIIVMTDEAHRSQYDVLALNMRSALPGASFIGFTGTPLIAGEEKTREVFGDYVSVYDFRQSIEDGATVPLYYENRIPELQLKDEELFDARLQEIIDAAVLEPEQEQKLERDFAREYHIITRDERLEAIAKDIVSHFMGRGFLGKAMVVAIDKVTAVRMHDKVRKYWEERLADLRVRLTAASVGADPDLASQVDDLRAEIEFMEKTDMAVVVSQAQNEEEDMRAKGVEILPHRLRMNQGGLDKNFKDPADPLRLVFVCAMWMTGFDVPSCSTIYLDKPLKNHTLMQTIARANRVYEDKAAGLIVDYVGIFRNLEKALAIYGAGDGKGDGAGDDGKHPAQDKSELVDMLCGELQDAESFLTSLGVDVSALGKTDDAFQWIALRDAAVEQVLLNDETKMDFISRSNRVTLVFRAILPDRSAEELAPRVEVFSSMRGRLRSLVVSPTLPDELSQQIEELLDEHILPTSFGIKSVPGDGDLGDGMGGDGSGDGLIGSHLFDLSKIDFQALQERFRQGNKRTELERLKNSLSRRIEAMLRLNKNRMHLHERLREIIDAYNSGSRGIEDTFKELQRFIDELKEEDHRAIREELSEEELALFDILVMPERDLTKKEEAEVKKICRVLLESLNHGALVIDWKKKLAARAAVKVAIRDSLDALPECFDRERYSRKCDDVYQHVYEHYLGEGQSVYAEASVS